MAFRKNQITRRESFSALGVALPAFSLGVSGCNRAKTLPKELSVDFVVIGGGLGGCAAALSALQFGLTVVMTEETDWIGGQLTSQGVPPDEHQWIEEFGCTQTYRDLRNAIRSHYKKLSLIHI